MIVSAAGEIGHSEREEDTPMLWLVRHGESAANAGGVTSDYAAIPLTDRGRAQAEAVAAACHEPPAWIGRSAYLRARQTAAPLLARYPGSPVADLAVHEFTYLAAERCLGMDATARQPLVDAYWSRMEPDYCDGEGAESFSGLCGRARAFLQYAAEHPGFGVVFTHEQFIRAVLLAVMYPWEWPSVSLMRLFFALRAGLPVPTGAVVRLQRESDRWWIGGVDVSHLPGTESDATPDTRGILSG
jgi:broad specificity phosphatase PhoE